MFVLGTHNYRQQTMRFRLACLVAACVLPVVMAAGFLVLHAYQYKRSLIEQHMLETARALTLTVDRDLASIQSAQQVLATSPHLVSGDLAGFHAQAREVLRGFPGADIILAEANGQQMVNTYRRFGEVLPKRNAPALVQRIFETGKPVISDLFLGAVTKRPLIGVDVPVFADGRVVYDLSMTLPADRLGAILAQQRLPSQWTGSILDSNRVIVARTSEPEKFVGRQAGPALRQQMAESKEGTAEVHNIAGTRVLDAFSQSAVSDWAVVIGVPAAIVGEEIWQWLWWTLGGILVLSIVCIGLAMLMAGSIARSIQALVAPAVALGHGEAVSLPPLALKETNAVGEALLKASILLANRAEERDRAEQALAEHARLLKHQYESLRSLNDIAALPQAGASRQLTEALVLGLRHLGLSVGIVSRIEGQRYIIQHCSAPPEAGLGDGVVFELGSTYCSMTLAANDVVAISHMGQSPNAGHPCYRAFGLECYIGAPLTVHGHCYGTVNFSSAIPHPQEFDESDLEFIRLLARWMGTVLDRQMVHEELARSNAELEQFAYVASHDLREPLRQVSSYVTLLERRYADKLDNDARDFIGFAREGAKRMDRLILDLLEYSRIGRHERSMAEVDLAAVVAEAVRNLDIVIKDAGARVEVAKDLPIVAGDHIELVRLFQNLVGNAVKYRASARPPVITITVRRSNQHWVIIVGDNGIGIAHEHFDRLFRIFQRLHGRGEYEGTGIGLASCKKITEHHGGRIWLESKPNEGSQFFVSLPVAVAVDSPSS